MFIFYFRSASAVQFWIVQVLRYHTENNRCACSVFTCHSTPAAARDSGAHTKVTTKLSQRWCKCCRCGTHRHNEYLRLIRIWICPGWHRKIIIQLHAEHERCVGDVCTPMVAWYSIYCLNSHVGFILQRWWMVTDPTLVPTKLFARILEM